MKGIGALEDPKKMNHMPKTAPKEHIQETLQWHEVITPENSILKGKSCSNTHQQYLLKENSNMPDNIILSGLFRVISCLCCKHNDPHSIYECLEGLRSTWRVHILCNEKVAFKPLDNTWMTSEYSGPCFTYNFLRSTAAKLIAYLQHTHPSTCLNLR